jgi:hypothetical protein
VTLFEELMALVAALEEDGVAYGLVGGLAVAVWGAPRATKDIDLLVRPEQLERALAVASRLEFDLRAQPMTFRDGMRLQRVSRARGRELLTLDFILVDDNLESAWQSRVKLKSGERDLWVISRDALIAMKAAAARPQDIADIEKLTEIDR